MNILLNSLFSFPVEKNIAVRKASHDFVSKSKQRNIFFFFCQIMFITKTLFGYDSREESKFLFGLNVHRPQSSKAKINY